MLVNWIYEGSNTKSNVNIDKLVDDVITHPDFVCQDVKGFKTARELKVLDEYHGTSGTELIPNKSWMSASVSIKLPPAGRGRHVSEPLAPSYEVKGLQYRRPLDVIKKAFTEQAAEEFHISSFEEYWKPFPESPPMRIFSEIYNSNAFIEEDVRLKSQTPADGLEPVIASVILYSDSTHLTNFGNSSLWPIYLYIGNQTKYTRGKPSLFSAHHLAYIPKVSLVI